MLSTLDFINMLSNKTQDNTNIINESDYNQEHKHEKKNRGNKMRDSKCLKRVEESHKQKY